MGAPLCTRQQKVSQLVYTIYSIMHMASPEELSMEHSTQSIPICKITIVMARSLKSEELHRHLLGLTQGGLSSHEKLPTERELADQFGLSRLTVRRVLDRLEQDRLVYRVQGSGTFVAGPRIAKALELTSFTEDMRTRRMEPGSRLLRQERIPAGPDVALALALSPADDVFHLHRVRTADGAPMAVEHAFLPARLFRDGLPLDEDASLYRTLTDTFGLRPHHARQAIRATVLGLDDAEALDVPPFTAAFDVRRTVFDARERPIEHAKSLYRADRYSFDMTLFRDGEDHSS